jgi:uncharacterized protein YjbJ (UPF0337 family)
MLRPRGGRGYACPPRFSTASGETPSPLSVERKFDRKGIAMGMGDDIKHNAEDLKGKAKEAVGDMTDNERLEAEGKADQTKANLKKAGDDVKDAFRS